MIENEICAYCRTPIVRAENQPNSRSVEHMIPNAFITRKRKNGEGDFYVCRQCNSRKSHIDNLLGKTSKMQSPNTEIASQANLSIDDGIVVDDRCETEDPAIFAVGDCTNHPNALMGKRLRLESVHNALEQAKTAASNICGVDKQYAQIPWFWSDQYDLKLQIAGISSGYDKVIVRGDLSARSFACLYLRDGQLIAVDAVNKPKDFVQGKALIINKAVIDARILANPELALSEMEY